MKIDLTLECPVRRTFRVDQVAGMFDVPLAKKSTRSWSVELPDVSDEWQIGAIVGPSGSGKSVIARKAYGKRLVQEYRWPADKAIVDAFPESIGAREITAMLNSVGFSSPPEWVKPYGVLSNGQRFRCDLARALLTPAEVIAFDEFTSVVDRQVAQFGSAAVAKTIRKGRTEKGARRFVAVTCHYDVLAWLQPDWVLDLAAGGRLARGWLRREQRAHRRFVGERPAIRLDVHRVGRRRWDLFKHHHYLSARLHQMAACYEASWRGTPVAFCATIHNAGHRKYRLIHRVVVLPDYQGLGLGLRLLDYVAARESSATGERISIRTSHPSLIRALQAHRAWRLTDTLMSGHPHRTLLPDSGARTIGSVGRSTAAFVFIPPPARSVSSASP